VAYLVLFGIGTIVGMMLITLIICPRRWRTPPAIDVVNALRVAPVCSAWGFGLFLVYHIGFVNGLFTGHAVWTPK